MTQAIAALNVGSSSVKLAAFDAGTLEPLARGEVGGIGAQVTAAFQSLPRAAPGAGCAPAAGAAAITDFPDAAEWLLRALRAGDPDLAITALVQRVVHGGTRFADPVRIDDRVLDELDALAPLAPTHQPAALDVIRSTRASLPGIPHLACFDTAFHRTQPKLAQWFALPRALAESGIVRIGFHGLSYQYVAGVLPDLAGARARGRVVAAHLGNGASVCALRDLRSVGTSMGFTPLDGLMMGTRCGAIDPGVVLYLIRQRGMAVADVEDLLGKRSGLLGVSGLSADMRVLEASDAPSAREALAMYADRAAAAIAAQCAAIDGLDALVFTGGVGEHSSATRARICERLRWLGVALDPEANRRHAATISAADRAIAVYVIPTNEELVMARAARAALRG